MARPVIGQRIMTRNRFDSLSTIASTLSDYFILRAVKATCRRLDAHRFGSGTT